MHDSNHVCMTFRSNSYFQNGSIIRCVLCFSNLIQKLGISMVLTLPMILFQHDNVKRVPVYFTQICQHIILTFRCIKNVFSLYWTKLQTRKLKYHQRADLVFELSPVVANLFHTIYLLLPSKVHL